VPVLTRLFTTALDHLTLQTTAAAASAVTTFSSQYFHISCHEQNTARAGGETENLF
jgi:hypothetical protein